MDRLVTAKFWRIEKANDDVPSFSACLRAIAKRPLSEREDKIGNTYLMRLERLEEEGSFLAGEFVRRQIENIPPNAKTGVPMEPLKLGSDGSLAHRSAFRFHSKMSILVLQSSQGGVRPPSVSSYITRFEESQGYVAKPVLPSEVWQKLSASAPRRFRLKVAEPHNLGLAEDTDGGMQRVLEDLNDTYGGVELVIEVSAGRKRNAFLNKVPLLHLVRSLTRRGSAPLSGVKALSVGVDTGEGIEELDFLTGQLVEKEQLRLPDDDVEGHYRARQEFLRSVVQRHWQAIREQMRDG